MKWKRPPTIVLVLAALALILLAACDDGDDAGNPEPTATPSGQAATPTADFAAELGSDPVFYRTTDGFQTIAAGEPYKVLLRITNGYAEETLRVVAERPSDGLTVEFEPLRSEPVGDGNEPGAYYPLALELPEAGAWQLRVTAGADEVDIFVNVPSDVN